MPVVAKSTKPKLTVHVEQADMDLLKAVSKEFPGVSEAFLIRAALRVGLPAISQDRSKLSTPPVAKGREASIQASPAADGLTPRTQQLLEDEDPEADKRRRDRGETRKRKRES